MITGIMSGLIVPALIEGGKKFGTMVFREEDIRDWVDSSDFREYLDEEVLFEAPPEPAPEPAVLTEFFSSDMVSLTVEQVFEQNGLSLSKLEEDFVRAFEDCIPDSKTQNQEFAHWLFWVLISAFEAFLSTRAKKGNKYAEEYLHVVRHKKEVEGQKEIVEKVDGVQMSVTELQRFIERSFSGGPPRFTPWREYFHRVERHLLPLDVEPRLTQTAYYLDRSEKFLADNFTKILVLHAPGGSGKSHLLRQIAFDLEGKHPEYTILSVTPGFPNMESALSGELDGDRRYLLQFDDADRWPEMLDPLFAYVKYHSSNVKIILTARTAGLRGIKTALNERFCQDLAEEVRIGDWSRDDLKGLLWLVLGGRHHNKEELIVSMLPNPYLIVWAGNVINGDPEITVERLRRKFVDDLEFEATRSLLPEFDKGKVGEFLADLALIGPFRRNDRVVLSLLKERFGLTEDTLQAQLDQMVEYGVLREVGYSTRFNPDMKGDLYLAHYIDRNRKSDALKGWIESWGPKFNDNILTSLEAASRFCKGDIIKDYFASWVREAIAESRDLPGYYRTKHLEALSRFCYLVPEESIDLMYAYIDTPPSGSEDDAILSPNRDTYGAVVVQLIHAGISREVIFDLLEHIHKNVPNGQYFNYTVESMVAETVSPFYNTLEKIRETLTLLEDRLDGENVFSVIALGKALSEALRADHEMSYLSSPNTITWGARPLPATPAVLETREHAILILKRTLCHKSVQVRRKAVEVCGEIGSKFGNGECPLSERIAEERRIILAGFEQLIPHETDYGVLSDIENLLLEWWQYKRPGTEDVEFVLSALPRPMEYVLYGFLFYARPLLLSFDLEKIPSDEKGRKEWYFNVSRGYADSGDAYTEFCECIVKYLSTTYPDIDSIAALFGDLQAYEEHANLNSLRLRPILTSWIAKRPGPFLELRHQGLIWSEMPVELQNAIDIGLCNYDPEQIEIFASEILVAPQSVDSRRIDILVWLMTRFPPDEARVEGWLTKLIETGRKEVHLTLLRNLWTLSLSLRDCKICIMYYMGILNCYEVLDHDLLDVIVTYVLHDLTENEDRLESDQKGAIKKCFRDKLISAPSLGAYPEYELQAMINYVLTDAGDIIDFIRFRAEKKRIISNYQILPLNGVSLCENIRSCSELYPFLDELFALLNRGLIYRGQLSVQVKAISSLKCPTSGRLCLEEYTEHLLNKDRLDDALILCPVLLPLSGTEDTTLKILHCAIGAGKGKNVKRLFADYIRGGVTSIDAGGHSPELEQKREVIARLLSLAPRGQQRVVLRDVLQWIDAEILDAKRDYEEDSVTR